MAIDFDMTHTRLDRLAYLAHRTLCVPSIGCVCRENTTRLVCQALKTAALAYEQIGTADHQRVAAEVTALRRWILEQAQAVGLRIGDNDNWQ
jgi:hypothetical protein